MESVTVDSDFIHSTVGSLLEGDVALEDYLVSMLEENPSESSSRETVVNFLASLGGIHDASAREASTRLFEALRRANIHKDSDGDRLDELVLDKMLLLDETSMLTEKVVMNEALPAAPMTNTSATNPTPPTIDACRKHTIVRRVKKDRQNSYERSATDISSISVETLCNPKVVVPASTPYWRSFK